MNKFVLRSAISAAALTLGFTAANAFVADTKTLNVQLQVNSSCSITNLPPVTFSALTGTNTTTTQNLSTTMSVSCQGIKYSVNANAGENATTPGNVTTRQMANGANIVPYHLYTASGGPTEWGSGGGSGGVALPPPSGVGTASDSITFYPQLVGGQSVVSGTYSDTVTVTLTY